MLMIIRSVSSKLNALSLKPGACNKRAATEPARDKSPEESRPSKIQRPVYADAQSFTPAATSSLAISVPKDSSNIGTHLDGFTTAKSLQRSAGSTSVDEDSRHLLADHHTISTSPPSSPVFTSGNRESAILLQPETRPITPEQLVNEVKGIYAGLVMVEKKCVEVYFLTIVAVCGSTDFLMVD
jgi:hypothetical protein